MKATIVKGRQETVGAGIEIIRSLPNSKFNSIGSVVFIDHLVEKTLSPKKAEMPDGGFAHPHRGIATFTYILAGGVHHLDSNGGEGTVYEGGIQWMKSGDGIVHDEFLPYDIQESGGKQHGLQFWLNLPAKNKAEKPAYVSVQGKDVPEINLPNEAGKMRVLLGEYEDKKSIIPGYLDQFMGHIKIEAGKSIQIDTIKDREYGLYVIQGNVKVDSEIEVKTNHVTELSDFGAQIKLSNEGPEVLEFIFFGGEAYKEPVVSYGPFIMNKNEEINLAYSDYRNGKYGKIDYSKVKL